MAEDEAIRETLEVLAEDIVSYSGFGAAVLSVRSSPGDLKVVAAAGDERVRDSLMDARLPLPEVNSLLDIAEPWGKLRFLTDVTATAEATENSWTWLDNDPRPPSEVGRMPAEAIWMRHRWQKENALLAPLLREDGELLGLLSVDLPVDGLTPSEAQRATLAMYARQAERTIAAAAHRTQVIHELRLAQAARLVVREAGTQLNVADLLPAAQAALLSKFAVQHVWIQTTPVRSNLDLEGAAAGAPQQDGSDGFDPRLLRSLSTLAEWCWTEQDVHVVSGTSAALEGHSSEDLRRLTGFLDAHQVASALVVPLGSGQSQLGVMVLGRGPGARPWTEAEKSVALDIGHDIGRAILHALWFEAQQQAAEELREHNEHKRQLLMTMSHELQTPLASIRNHAELVIPDLAHDPTTRRAVLAINRGADRLTKLVNNMVWIARIDDPHRPVDTADVDVVALARLVVDDAARADHVVLNPDPRGAKPAHCSRALWFTPPPRPVWVRGSDTELTLVWCNLVANALKFTDDGGQVWVEIQERAGEVEVSVVDDGIGIAPDELPRIFDDFYRSPSKACRDRPGTGLGLAIVKRIVDRHGGSMTATSLRPAASPDREPTWLGPTSPEPAKSAVLAGPRVGKPRRTSFCVRLPLSSGGAQ